MSFTLSNSCYLEAVDEMQPVAKTTLLLKIPSLNFLIAPCTRVFVCVAQLLTASMELISQMRLRSWSMICFRCWFFCFSFCRKNIEKRWEKACFRYKSNKNYKCESSLVTEKKKKKKKKGLLKQCKTNKAIIYTQIITDLFAATTHNNTNADSYHLL